MCRLLLFCHSAESADEELPLWAKAGDGRWATPSVSPRQQSDGRKAAKIKHRLINVSL